MTASFDHRYCTWLEGELRSDHAGETGAVWIYRGVLAANPKHELRQFCLRHLATEERHLEKMNMLLAPNFRSALLPLWRVAGFLTGFLPGCLNDRAVYLTVSAVETFVQRHYQQQIEHPELLGYPDIKAILVACMNDEIEHKDEAAELSKSPNGKLAESWCALVGSGSSIAVNLARRY